MIDKSVVYQKSRRFSIRVVGAYRYLREEKKEFVLSKQFLRCGTSIGANVAEANGALSHADFSAKISIAYKETLETKYWIDLLKDTGLIDTATHASMYADADELAKMLFSILKATRLKQRTPNRQKPPLCGGQSGENGEQPGDDESPL